MLKQPLLSTPPMQTKPLPKLLLTGATGFLGSHLVPLLVDAGYEVTCLVRSTSKTAQLPANASIKTVDLCERSSLIKAMADHDILVHMAALLFGLSWQDYFTSNVQAAQEICAACAELGSHAPKKVVLISSLAAQGPSKGMQGLSEDDPPRPVSAYGWSKLLVERTFQSNFASDLCILRPGIIYGSLDRGLLPVFQAAKLGFGTSPGYGRLFPISCIHGHDMARVIVHALQREAKGLYLVSDGQTYTMDDFLLAMFAALHKSPHIFHIPLPVMYLSAALATSTTLLWRAITRTHNRRAPNWHLDKYAEARCAGWVINAAKLLRDLDFTPDHSLQSGMEESVAGYRKRGWL